MNTDKAPGDTKTFAEIHNLPKRQALLAKHLREAGMGDHILHDGDCPILSSTFCQLNTARRIERFELKIANRFAAAQTAGLHLVCAQLAIPNARFGWLELSDLKKDRARLKELVTSATRRAKPVKHLVGRYSFDRHVGLGEAYWQQSMRIVMAVKPTTNRDAAGEVEKAFSNLLPTIGGTMIRPKAVTCPIQAAKHCTSHWLYGDTKQIVETPSMPPDRMLKLQVRTRALEAEERKDLLAYMECGQGMKVHLHPAFPQHADEW